jgi:hypothetical protein
MSIDSLLVASVLVPPGFHYELITVLKQKAKSKMFRYINPQRSVESRKHDNDKHLWHDYRQN